MSRVQEWVEKAAAESKEQFSSHDALKSPRAVTVRLTGLLYGGLRLVSNRVGFTPTGCAEELLEQAIEDALQVVGYASLKEAIPDIIAELGGVENVVDQLQEPFVAEVEGQTVVVGTHDKAKARRVARSGRVSK
jgi:hypothetical protein